MATMSTITSAPVISLVAVPSEETAGGDSISNSPSRPAKLNVEAANNIYALGSLQSPGDIPYDPTDSEPFPEYEEVEKHDDSFDVAYKKALMATMQDTIRMQVVDPKITPTSQLSDKKEETLAAMKEGLSHPHLVESSRENFIELTNMVIRMDNLLFPATIGESLDTEATTEAREIAHDIFNWVSWVEDMMQELIVDAGNVHHKLNSIVNNNKISELDRHIKMSQLAST